MRIHLWMRSLSHPPALISWASIRHQGFLMVLGELEMKLVPSQDFSLVEREYVVMLVVASGNRKRIMAVWAKEGRGAVVGPGTIPKSVYSLFLTRFSGRLSGLDWSALHDQAASYQWPVYVRR